MVFLVRHDFFTSIKFLQYCNLGILLPNVPLIFINGVFKNISKIFRVKNYHPIKEQNHLYQFSAIIIDSAISLVFLYFINVPHAQIFTKQIFIYSKSVLLSIPPNIQHQGA